MSNPGQLVVGVSYPKTQIKKPMTGWDYSKYYISSVTVLSGSFYDDFPDGITVETVPAVPGQKKDAEAWWSGTPTKTQTRHSYLQWSLNDGKASIVGCSFKIVDSTTTSSSTSSTSSTSSSTTCSGGLCSLPTTQATTSSTVINPHCSPQNP